MLRTSFGRIRPGHPTTSYPGVAQLVARLLWEDRRSIHSPKSESPEVLGTVACGGNPPPEDPPAKPALTTALPTDTKNLLFPSPHGIMQKNRISGYSAVGSAPALGAGCRAFESHYSDQMSSGVKTPGGFFFVYCSAIPDVISGPLYSQFFLLLNGNQSHSRLTGLSRPICCFLSILIGSISKCPGIAGGSPPVPVPVTHSPNTMWFWTKKWLQIQV